MKQIFATVGTQLAYPRLLDAVAAWARQRPAVEVFAQTADPKGSWQAMRHVAFLEPAQYSRRFAEADLVVGHAGMGTILGALELGKPIVILPRKASLGEHRNEHQASTAERFRNCPAVHVVDEADTLGAAIDAMLGSLRAERISVPPAAMLAARIRCELQRERARSAEVHPKLLAVASGGGHWVQLCRLLRALDHPELVCATTALGDRSLAPCTEVHQIRDGNRWSKVALARSAADVFRLVARVRPDVVLTTGAAPGYFALRAGKLLGAGTIWLDSLANAETLSLAGQKAGKHAQIWLTQWPELARAGGPEYAGTVLPLFESPPTNHTIYDQPSTPKPRSLHSEKPQAKV